MENKKIIIYEPQCRGIEHLNFNTSMIKIINEIKKQKKYFGSKDQIYYLKKEIEAINYIPTKIPLKNEKKLLKILIEIKNLLKLRKEGKDDIYIFLSVTPITVIFSKILLKKRKKIFIWHSILENLKANKKLKPWKLEFWIKPSLVMKDKNFKNIVLGESIKNNLLAFFPQLKKELYSLDHPYEFCKINHKKECFKKNIKIGTIGFGSRAKGIDKIYKLEKRIKKYKGVNLEVIGKIVDDTINFSRDSNIKVHGENGDILPNEFNNLIEKLDYALYLYPRESYKYFASGAVFDAISHLKPIIAIKNDYFDYIFKKFGDIGYLCNSYEELFDVVEKIIKEKDIEKYRLQQENILRGQKYFTLDFIKNDFFEILEGEK